MAVDPSGFLFTLAAKATEPIPGALSVALDSGFHGTWQAKPGKAPSRRAEAFKILADYFCAREGDFVFFFAKRRVYLGGILTAPQGHASVAWENWQGASRFQGAGSQATHLAAEGLESTRIPWLLTFTPTLGADGAPLSIDMDELLQEQSLDRMQSLRTFSGLNLLRLDPEETGWTLSVLLRAGGVNLDSLKRVDIACSHTEFARRAQPLSASALIHAAQGWKQKTEPMLEGALESWVAAQITQQTEDAKLAFGGTELSFLSTQQFASPLKPRNYMDMIDLYGLERMDVGPGVPRPNKRYLVIEMKVSSIVTEGSASALGQLMKYVDWIAMHKAGGDYSRIEAYLVALEFSHELIEEARRFGSIGFRKPGRNAETHAWQGLQLVRIDLDAPNGPSLGRVSFRDQA